MGLRNDDNIYEKINELYGLPKIQKNLSSKLQISIKKISSINYTFL